MKNTMSKITKSIIRLILITLILSFIFAFIFGVITLQNTQINQFDPHYVVTVLGKPDIGDFIIFNIIGFTGFVLIVNSVLTLRQIALETENSEKGTTNSDPKANEHMTITNNINRMYAKLFLYSIFLFFLIFIIIIFLFSTL